MMKNLNMYYRKTPGQDSPRSSKALFEDAMKQLVQVSSDRKKIMVKIQLSKGDMADILLDSSRRNDESLMTQVQSFVTSIESGCALEDAVAASLHLSSVLGCELNLTLPGDGDVDMLFFELVRESESVIQDCLKERWLMDESIVDSCVMDTHDSNFKAPIFNLKLPDRRGDDRGWTNSAKPDFTSLAAPMFLEIKDVKLTPGCSIANGATMMNNEYEVLDQAIERVQVAASQNELLRRIFCFASTGSRSWLVYCERSHELTKIFTDGSDLSRRCLPLLTETYHIIPIATQFMLGVWKSITRAAISDKGYYAHPDAFFVADILKQMNFDLAYSRIKIIGNSGAQGSIVYGISPGYPYYAARTGRNGMCFTANSSFAIKVHQEQGRGNNEVKILRLLKGCKFVGKYVVGIFSYNLEENSSKSGLEFEYFLDARSGTSEMSFATSDSSVPMQGLRLFDIPAALDVASRRPNALKFTLTSQ